MLLTRANGSGEWHENSCLEIVGVKVERNDVDGYYELLGVSPDASDEEVRRAGKQLVMRTHPDLGGDGEEFQQAVKAYKTLSDARSRAEYDTRTKAPQVRVRTAYSPVKREEREPCGPAWYKEPTLLLTREEEDRVRRWHRMVLEAARGSRLPLEIKVGVCRYSVGYYLQDDIAVIGRSQEPDGRMARCYVLMRMCERK